MLTFFVYNEGEDRLSIGLAETANLGNLGYSEDRDFEVQFQIEHLPEDVDKGFALVLNIDRAKYAELKKKFDAVETLYWRGK